MPPESPQKPRGRPRKAAAAQPAVQVVYRAPALDKGLDILELLATQPQGLTRSQIVKDMARSPNEIYRMLERLVARQYVTRSASGDRYALSLKLFAMAHAHPPLNRLINQALPVMDDFACRAEQSCHMGVYDRGNVLIAAQINSPRGWSFSVQRGARVGLLDTASGHMLLAYADADSRQRMLAEHRPLDGEVPVTDDGLAQTLAAIRAQSGVAALQGQRHTYFCGAWTGYGFHEDGLKSGLRVAALLQAAPAQRLGVRHARLKPVRNAFSYATYFLM
eukprot:gene46177-61750_t